MAKINILFFAMTAATFGLWACGTDDGGKEGADSEDDTGNGGDTDGDTAGDTDGDTDIDTDRDAGHSTDDTAAVGTDEIDGLTACTDFLTISWDRMRECDNPQADALPSNDLAGGLCTALCGTIDAPISSEAYSACVDYVNTVACDDINITLDLSGGSQLPDECAFLDDTAGCPF